MQDFIAFDFETANRNRHSICSVGMIVVENREIVDSIYQLIDPEEEFDSFNIAIHNIKPKDIKGKPTFDKFYQSVRDKISKKVMVAHYLAFDGYALRDNLTRYEIEPCNNQLLCTYQLSKRLIANQPSYSIDSLCHYYGIDLTNHHHALSDAQACAELMIKLVAEFELDDLDNLFNKTGINPGVISPELYRSSLINNKRSLDLRDIEISANADVDNPFYNKNIVFTGKLNVFSRKDAAQLVAKKGGKPQNGLNKDTDFIIIGDFKDVMIKGNKSAKLKKAEKMVSEGKELEIISEQDFMKML